MLTRAGLRFLLLPRGCILPAGLGARRLTRLSWGPALSAGSFTRLSRSTTLSTRGLTLLPRSGSLPLLPGCRAGGTIHLTTVAKTRARAVGRPDLMRILTRLLFLANPLANGRSRINLSLLTLIGAGARLTTLHARLCCRSTTGCSLGRGPGARPGTGLHRQRDCGSPEESDQSRRFHCHTHNLLPTGRSKRFMRKHQCS